LYRIMPLKQAEITVPLGLVIMMEDVRALVSGPVYVWVIEGESEKIVVDCGVQEGQGASYTATQ